MHAWQSDNFLGSVTRETVSVFVSFERGSGCRQPLEVNRQTFGPIPSPGTIRALSSLCLLRNASGHSLRTCRRSSPKETSMANESKDQPVRGHIDCLVKEEERLYARSALTHG